MVQRIRTQSTLPASGKWVQIGGIPCHPTDFPSSFNRYVSVCTDNVLAGDNHPFDVTVTMLEDGLGVTTIGPACSGQPAMTRLENYYPSGVRSFATNTDYGHLTIASKPSNGELAAKLLANTNPSRPVVDLPIFVFELREIPHLFKGYGDNWLKNVANGNLSYQFGIKPLISDLKSLLNFADEFAKREREVEALASGGLRRKQSLWKGSNQDFIASRQTNSGAPGSAFHSIQRTTVEETWGFVRWIPTAAMPKTSEERKRLARRAVLGLEIDFSTFWNIMPWSWLIDWTSSVGNYLAASRNIIPCSPTDISIMSHRTTESYLKKLGTSNLPNIGSPIIEIQKLGDYKVKKESKTRSPATPTLAAHLPCLSARQLSILGSIGVKKYR